MVSLLAFYSDGLISNPAEVYKFSVGKNENKQKEAGVGPFLFKMYDVIGQVFWVKLEGPTNP